MRFGSTVVPIDCAECTAVDRGDVQRMLDTEMRRIHPRRSREYFARRYAQCRRDGVNHAQSLAVMQTHLALEKVLPVDDSPAMIPVENPSLNQWIAQRDRLVGAHCKTAPFDEPGDGRMVFCGLLVATALVLLGGVMGYCLALGGR